MSDEKMCVLLICSSPFRAEGARVELAWACARRFSRAVPCHSEHPSSPPPLAEGNPKLQS